MLGSAAQRAHMLKITGQPVVFGTRRTYGSLERTPIDVVAEGNVPVTIYRTTLIVADGDAALAGVKVDSRLTVGGRRFAVRDPGIAGDDGFRTYELAEVP